MDPPPWSPYASYNRLAGVQASAASGELHHHLPTSAASAPPTTTAQLIPGGFLSPPPVGYETVLSPFFHHAGAKAPHYVTQHRAQTASKQNEGEYHQTQAFFEQGAGAWQQNSPFGILPHESVVSSGAAKTAAYENFNAHFPLNHLAKNATSRAQSPQVSSAAAKPTSNTSFFQGAAATTFSTANTQSCIVTSPSNTPVSKEYRVPQAPGRGATFLSSPRPEKTFAAPKQQNQQQQIQTKAQTKIYPELNNQNQKNAEENQSQSSPISFSLNYNNNSGKRGQFQHSNYRHYQQGTNTETDFQRPKSGSDYSNTNGPDCNVVVPRRPSPLQAHSQASPLGHAPSPAYPMYNSPMNSISSPQQNSSNQVTPPSPLDVSVQRPNSQTGNVAYPSVITRALNAEKTFPERYERPVQQNNQNCWEDRQNSRKFQGNQTVPTSGYNSGNSIELAGRGENVGQRGANLVSLGDRPQNYFEAGHQVTLQDLSSCRGDPMSIVKNLQQQQTCPVPQNEIKQEPKMPAKRRKSSEKPNPPASDVPGPTMEYISGRIPPPAHSSAMNQQQQNGGYFDFDRWNLPPPASKIFATQAVHQQHQSLMVPHPHTHHPPPPLPYFPPFHLPTHPPEFPSTVELTPISTSYGDQGGQPSNTQYTPPQEESQPKVVVPNIEEELNFLSEGSGRPAPTTSTPIAKPPPVAPIIKQEKPTGPGAGFMNSYLKFLQGERDSSPPPASRGARKQTWTRTPKPTLQQQPENKPPDTNGVPATTAATAPPPAAPAARLSQGDPQDDPRYFPLPKERKRRSFDSSDDGISSEDDLFTKKILNAPTKEGKEKNLKKGRPPKPGGPTERKKKKNNNNSSGGGGGGGAAAAAQQQQTNNKESKVTAPVQRRETSKRAAKEKGNMQLTKQGGGGGAGADDDPEEPPEFADSDSDPAWTPQAKNDAEEEIVMDKRKRRGRPPGSRRKTKNLIAAAAQGAGIQDVDGFTNDSKKHTKSSGKQKAVAVPPTLEDNIAAAVAMQNSSTPNLGEDNPFKPGEFVVIKTELNQEWPAIWRVDGKTLLQKYEPFEQNGQTLYRNISTYTSWTPESRKQYITVPVRYKGQSHMETIVEFLRNEVTVIDQEVFDRAIKECEMFQDNFEVYIQTLISQALDSNFLTEIFQEKDDYFLTNVKTIDDITESKKQKLVSLLGWPQALQAAVGTWPCFNVLRELNVTNAQTRVCVACSQMGVAVRVLMYGQPYNSTTLEGCQPDPRAVNEKDFLMCRMCANRIELYNKISHQKYLMYIECAKRVAEKRTAESHKDTTCILNELLADENWLNQLFLDVRSSWAEVDSLEHSYRVKCAKGGASH